MPLRTSLALGSAALCSLIAFQPAAADTNSPLVLGFPASLTNLLLAHDPGSTQYLGDTSYQSGTFSMFQYWLFDSSTNAYSILGLTGHPYTDANNFTNAQNVTAYPAFITGESFVYSSNGSSISVAPWVFDRSTLTTTPLGLTGPQYVSVNGIPDAIVNGALDGRIIGVSFAPSTKSTFIWSFDPVSHQYNIITPSDAAHTDNSGNNTLSPIWTPGFTTITLTGPHYSVFGSSNPPTANGSDAYATNIFGAAPVAIGLFDAAHTNFFGLQDNTADLTNGDLIAGHTKTYVNFATRGQDAWVYDNLSHTTTIAGLTDSSHVATNGTRLNSVTAISSTGFLAGTSTRYSGNGVLAVDAWFQAPHATALQIGLNDPAHTNPLRISQNAILSINRTGQTVGTAIRADNNHSDVWVYNPLTNSTILSGLQGGDNDLFLGQNFDSGFVFGHTADSVTTGSGRFWVYNPITTHTSLLGFDMPSSTGEHLNISTLFTPAGYAAGTTVSFNGTLESTRHTWFYDPASNTNIDLSAFGSFGMTPSALSPDGVLYGQYGTSQTSASSFSYSPTAGFVDLNVKYRSLLDSIGALNFSFITITADGNLVAQVAESDPHYSPVILLASAPEPASLALFAFATTALLLTRGPRSRTHRPLRQTPLNS